MKILIASGSFKDVYTPMQACEMISDIIISLKLDDISVEIFPMADGGEYSNEVLLEAFNYKKIFVDNIINPYGKKKISYYLEFDKDSVFIGSSEILGLSPEEEIFKNPLKLSSYGLGQLIADAIEKGYKSIYLGLGGTSTVDGGIGMVQALGGIFYSNGRVVDNPNKYLTGDNLSAIDKIDLSKISKNINNIKLTAVCDAMTNIEEMYTPTNQKISDHYRNKRKVIVSTLENSLKSYCEVVTNTLTSTNRWYYKNLMNCNYLGVAGGINIGLLPMFNHRTILGSSYFIDMLNLEKSIQNADLVITGEGKFDNSLEGKSPVGVSQLSKKYKKTVVLLCGTVDLSMKKHFKSYIGNKLPEAIEENGIQTIISGYHVYNNMKLPNSYSDRVELYRKNNPEHFRKGLEIFFKRLGN